MRLPRFDALGMDVYVSDETVVERATVFNVRPEDDRCAAPPCPLVSYAVHRDLIFGSNLVAFFGPVARLPLVFGFDDPVISAADIPNSSIIDFSFFTATSFFR